MFCLFYSLCWKIFALSCCLRNRIIHSITGTEYISTMHCRFFLHFILILQTLALGHIFTEPLLIHYLFYKMLMLNIHCPSKRCIEKYKNFALSWLKCCVGMECNIILLNFTGCLFERCFLSVPEKMYLVVFTPTHRSGLF